MTETTQTLTTLSRTEATLLSAFIYQIDAWLSQYGEKADHIEITYYPEDDGFDVSNNEPKKGKRITAFFADILTWANGQLKQLQGYNQENSVQKFTLSYKDNQYGVLVQTAPKEATSEL